MVRIVRGALFVVVVTAFGGCFGRSALESTLTDSSVAGRAGVESSAPAGNGGTRSLGTPRAPSTGGDASTASAQSRAASGGQTGDSLGEGGGVGPRPRRPNGDDDEPSSSTHHDAASVGPRRGAHRSLDGGVGGVLPAESQDELESSFERAGTSWPTLSRPSIYNFHWEKDRFPHPTYQMGTEEGYHEFAFVLIGFLDKDDNFAFLTDHHLVHLPLRYLFPSGSGRARRHRLRDAHRLLLRRAPMATFRPTSRLDCSRTRIGWRRSTDGNRLPGDLSRVRKARALRDGELSVLRRHDPALRARHRLPAEDPAEIADTSCRSGRHSWRQASPPTVAA